MDNVTTVVVLFGVSAFTTSIWRSAWSGSNDLDRIVAVVLLVAMIISWILSFYVFIRLFIA